MIEKTNSIIAYKQNRYSCKDIHTYIYRSVGIFDITNEFMIIFVMNAKTAMEFFLSSIQKHIHKK